MEITDKSGDSSPETSNTLSLRPLSLFGQVNLNIFWLANQFHWQALLAVVIPSMVAKFLNPAYKSINLALVVNWGTIVAFLVNPLVGALSDYARFRMGRRRPYMIIGTFLNVAVLVIFAFSPSWFPSSALLLIFSALFILLQFSNNLANAPWSAIIADNVPPQQRGISSGFNGLFNLLGTITGSIVAGIIVNKNDALPLYRNEIVQIFLLIAAVQIIFVAYTVLTVKETPLPSERHITLRPQELLKKFFFKPSTYPDLAWVLLARFLVMMGIWSIYYFLEYYFDDVFGGPGVKTLLFNTPFSGEFFNGALFQPVIMLTALPTSLLAGWASDHWGRKGLVYLSGAMMALVCAIFIFFPQQTFALLAGACFGIGYGAYTSVDWALTTDVLPPTNEAGKFMGIWSALGILPQVIGVSIGGVVLQLLRTIPDHFGYTSLFLLTVIYLILGTGAIYRVKGVE
ncbi:MFS transporter [Ktedonosporobacter rubrisoli]|uniref:MFS transporter n=1 Tax=Ktedonosporobacter rubrisoli TaxID=2509675 RepID=A0A4P6K3R1_KTERU|nr:MFS transporter [Ktedonosporobacter rubrisoli]QBD82420.1 MFS transporter [Ktedonosporobacter rubrisoli]